MLPMHPNLTAALLVLPAVAVAAKHPSYPPYSCGKQASKQATLPARGAKPAATGRPGGGGTWPRRVTHLGRGQPHPWQS